MNNNTKAARERRVQRIKIRGQWRYDNMTKSEKETYVKQFGPAPRHPGKDAKLADLEKYGRAVRIWAAQAEGQRPYQPAFLSADS